VGHEKFEDALERLDRPLQMIAASLRTGIRVADVMFAAAGEARWEDKAPMIGRFEREDHRSAWACAVRATTCEALRDVGGATMPRANEGIAVRAGDGTELIVLRPDAQGRLPVPSSDARSEWYGVNGQQLAFELGLDGLHEPPEAEGGTLEHLVVLWDYHDETGLRMWLVAPKDYNGNSFWHEELHLPGTGISLDQPAEQPDDGGDIDLDGPDQYGPATGTEEG